MQLVRPGPEHLPAYIDALRRGWSPNTLRAEAAAEELEEIERDAAAFLALMDDPMAAGPPVVLPDGRRVPRIPGLRRWMWSDGHLLGSIGLRWMPDGAALPPHVLGHIGYAVVPWQQRRGYATAALARLLPLARDRGLPYVELTTDLDNVPSQRVIMANGGVQVETFDKGDAYGHAPGLRFRIDLGP